MKLKIISVLLTVVLSLTILSGCAKSSTEDTSSSDLVTTASIVDNATAFESAISKNGTWLIGLVKDVQIDKDIVLDGDFKNGKTDSSGAETFQRKIALYTQDEERNVTARFTLTAPKLTIKSVKSSIQHGTFKGDLYVAVNDFNLVDAKIEGNIYFESEEFKSSFTMDDKSSVTGVQEVK